MNTRSQVAGLLSMVAALLVPSWWLLPQVLAGLGAVSVLSAGCVLWLERLRPAFLVIAVGAIAYQMWLVHQRPPERRTRAARTILWCSVVVTLVILSGWGVLWMRYR